MPLKVNSKNAVSSKKNNKTESILKISEEISVFCGTLQDAEILDSEYFLFVLGREKFRTMTFLRECFYGKNATTGRI